MIIRWAVKKLSLRNDREYRKFAEFEIRMMDDPQQMIVEGYALTFDQPTVLFEMDGIQYKEMIGKGSLVGTDLTDVIFNYDHSGKVMARTRNNTLELTVDDRGLKIRARLDGTKEGQALYEEIKGGYIDRMSFAFMTSAEEYNKETRTRTITGIKKIYDVAAVSIPAYESTSISARSFFELEREKERKALDSAELRKKLIMLTYV
jgi:hypothetical protein